MTVKMKYIHYVVYLAMLCVCMGMILLSTDNTYADDNVKKNDKVIKVGYFAFDGYHNEDEDGVKSGYGYEYLQQIAKYTGWTYEYVGYDKSWSDAQKMLEDGKIDILTSAQKTPEREKIFDFSENPIGYSSTIFTIKAGDKKYTIDNFETFNGIRVGMIEGNSRNDEFDEFAKENGFSYEPIMFDDMDKLVNALQKDKIDSIVTSSLRVTNNEWVVSQFGFSPYYVCVKKGNSKLLAQINDAIGRINQDYPGLQNELEDKYYSTDSGENVAFTQEERNYISSFKENGKKLKVMINPDRLPLSYYEDGEPKGIFGETIKKILEMSGIPYEVVVPDDREQYEEYRNDHKVDLCMDLRHDYDMAEKIGYRVTDSYYSASVSRITKSSFSGKTTKIAAIRNSDVGEKLKKIYGDNVVIKYYDSTDECVEAVKSGEQDATYMYTYVTEAYISKDYAKELTTSLVPDFSTEFCIGIADTSDAILFSIMNKSVNGIESGWLDNITEKYTNYDDSKTSLKEMIYTHTPLVVGIIFLIVLLICVVVFMLYRQKTLVTGKEKADEIKRLFNYVCSEHDAVIEINLKDRISKEYQLKDDKLIIEEKIFDSKDNYNGFLYPEDYERLVGSISGEQLETAIKNGSQIEFEARGNNGNGQYIWYIYTIYGIIPDKAHPQNFMLLKKDINELKKKEEESKKVLTDALAVAKEASAAKGTFMSRMSHEIRTPLNAVIGYMEIAKDSEDNPSKMMHCVSNCDMAAKHLLSIINDVLDISSIESGRMKIANGDFDLKSQITSISTIFFNQAKEKGVRFETILEELTQEWVIGDSLRVNQILMNLLSNAIKFTPKGNKVTLCVIQVNLDDENVFMKFTVADTGIGMSKEYQKKLFTPFEQESATTAAKYGGTGLGLSITKNLVQLMDGSIDVRSEQGKGTTFVVSLRFGRSNKTNEDVNDNSDYSKLRVLLVDDDEAACEYMKELLKRCGVKSDVVFDGQAAIKQIKRRSGSDYKYDMCIMDWNMPDLNGIETARKIKAECDPNIPIIIATAYDVTEFEDQAKEIGIEKIIAKPLFQSTMFDLLVSTYGKYEPKKEKKHNISSIKGMHVLLAEDNPMNMEIAVETLTKTGIIVESVSDGKQALDAFISHEPGTYDAILMDVQMPVMDGYEATACIRKSAHSQAKTIPIIAMTANAFVEDVNAALASGMNDHISKPVNYDKLFDALSKYYKKGDNKNE